MNTTQQQQASVIHAPVSNTARPQDGSAAPGRLLPERSSGWDPFEVWRTRVKPLPDPAQPEWRPRR